MTLVTVNVKWQKEKYKNVECNTAEAVDNFKAQIFSLTGVPPERQKIMLAGKIIDSSFDGINIKEGCTLMMMGSAVVIENKGDSKPNAEVIAAAEAALNAAKQEEIINLRGLYNLGNTCYMNSVIQALYTIPELSYSLKRADLNSPSMSLLKSLSSLFTELDHSKDAIRPIYFLLSVHTKFPQFGIKASDVSESEGGGGGVGFQQQDANEFMLKLFHEMQNIKVSEKNFNNASLVPSFIDRKGEWNPIDKYFMGTMACKIKCHEDDTDVKEFTETFLQVPCFIDKDIKYLHTGIRNSLESKLTKRSEKLAKDAEYTKSSKFSRLPAMLTIQFVRFFYKEKQKINAKILKDVKFPLSLDMYEFCSEELKKSMDPMREKFRQEDERDAHAVKVRKANQHLKEQKKPHFYDEEDKFEPYWFQEDVGSNNSGLYQLQAVITHQGRSSSQAHYVAWCRHKDRWYKVDDEDVTITSEEEILRLSGGGDWHCAYLLIYGPRKLLKPEFYPKSGEEEDTTTAEPVKMDVDKAK